MKITSLKTGIIGVNYLFLCIKNHFSTHLYMILPVEFTDLMRNTLEQSDYDQLLSALDQQPSISVRINKLKANNIDELCLTDNLASVPWCKDGYYLDTRPQFILNPLFHAGLFYVQEASSMFLDWILHRLITDRETPVAVYDACAAPGGKSTVLLSALPDNSLVVSNEYVRHRANILMENIVKWGNHNVIVTSDDTANIAKTGEWCNLVVCDAPCSGEGMFRKEADAVEMWSMGNVHQCQKRQRKIIRNVWQNLLPDGYFIYSTCTYNKLEDEDNVQWMMDELNAQPVIIDDCPFENIARGLFNDESAPANCVFRFFPHRTKGEGLFISVLQKKESDGSSVRRPKTKSSNGNMSLINECRNLINHSDEMVFAYNNEKKTVTAFPKLHHELYSYLSLHINIIYAGVTLAFVKGNEKKGLTLQPDQSLAMSNLCNTNAFATQEVTLEQALQYLHGENIMPDSQTPRNFVLLTYKSHPIGFMKNLGNRTNNLYPDEWRIRKRLQ